MKYIGLDLGSKTLGVAISDELGMLARALETFRFPENQYEQAVNHIIHVCNREHVEIIILGLPKHMNGDEGIRAQLSYEFKSMIESKSKIKVILEDERLTTVMVDRAMISGNVHRSNRKEKKDEMAAVVILQNYLNRI